MSDSNPDITSSSAKHEGGHKQPMETFCRREFVDFSAKHFPNKCLTFKSKPIKQRGKKKKNHKHSRQAFG